MRLSLRPANPVLVQQLETERFILRSVGALELIGDPWGWRTNRRIYRDVYRFGKPMSFSQWLKQGPFPETDRRFTFAIMPKGTDTTIGLHMLRPNGWRTLGNTVGIHDEAWLGKNVAVEVRAKLMNHFFRHSDVQRFSSRVEAGNLPSVFTYRKLGYAHVGTLHRDAVDPETGRPLDFLLFEMLKENWMRSPYAEAGL